MIYQTHSVNSCEMNCGNTTKIGKEIGRLDRAQQLVAVVAALHCKVLQQECHSLWRLLTTRLRLLKCALRLVLEAVPLVERQ